jgi:hypothetical protein
MQLQRHGWDIHAVCAGVRRGGGPGGAGRRNVPETQQYQRSRPTRAERHDLGRQAPGAMINDAATERSWRRRGRRANRAGRGFGVSRAPAVSRAGRHVRINPPKSHRMRYVSGRMSRAGMVRLAMAAHHPVATRAARGMTGLPGPDGPGMSDSVTLAGLVRETNRKCVVSAAWRRLARYPAR